VGNIQPPFGIHVRHFSIGTKVYCLPAQWGDGYEKIVVIGRHRQSRRFVKLVIPSKFVKSLRAQVVYSPSVLLLIQGHRDRPGQSCWENAAEIEAFVQAFREQ
jgi:hypothetical protein